MMFSMEKSSFLRSVTGRNYSLEWEGGREREKGERVREGVLLKRSFGIGHKFDCWSNFSELRHNKSTGVRVYTDKMLIKII
jgi:hypothetical protein